jgi:hypothetical protein
MEEHTKLDQELNVITSSHDLYDYDIVATQAVTDPHSPKAWAKGAAAVRSLILLLSFCRAFLFARAS